MRDSINVIRELANGRGVEYNDSTITLPWASKSELEVWGAGYGPKALKMIGENCDGFILQLADPQLVAWMIDAVKSAASDAGRNPDDLTMCIAAPAYVSDDTAEGLAHARNQTRWFGGMVGNHVADIVDRYGDDAGVPQALTDYIKGRKAYDYNQHGSATSEHVDFVPDEVIDRFCLLGPVEAHLERLAELKALGVDQYAIYLQHDAKDDTLAQYGEKIIPVMTEQALAKQ